MDVVEMAEKAKQSPFCSILFVLSIQNFTVGEIISELM